MIVLTRREGESITVSDTLVVTVNGVRGGSLFLDVVGATLRLPLSYETGSTPSLVYVHVVPDKPNRYTIRCVEGDIVHLAANVTLQVMSVIPDNQAQQTRSRVRLGITAPADVSIYRTEIFKASVGEDKQVSQTVQDHHHQDEISYRPIPTEADLDQLPVFAQVAYAARCARRVLPLINLVEDSTQSGDAQAADHLIKSAQEMAARRNIESQQLYTAMDENDPHATVAFGSQPKVSFLVHRAATCTLNAAVAALGHIPHLALAKVNHVVLASVVEASKAARAALLAHSSMLQAERDEAKVFTAALTQLEDAMWWDYDLLAHAHIAERWLTSTGVEPEFFGPLWPDGPPSGWPQKEPTSENTELFITVDVPEGVTDEQVLELIAGLAGKADAVHRAYGGHGLEVEEGNVDVNCQVQRPVPAGGRS